ncbi:MAG: metallophosphoesterase [Nanoarchaeota archaeon]
MADLTVLHFTDLGEEYDRLAVLTDFVQRRKEQIAAVFFTGDFLEGNPQEGREVTANKMAQKTMEYVATEEVRAAEKTLRQFVQKHVRDGQFNPDTLGEAERKELEQLLAQQQKLIMEEVNEHKLELKNDLMGIVEDSYKRLATEFHKFPCTVFATLGNHDFTLGYEQFDPMKVVFVDKANEEGLADDEVPVIISRTGRQYIIKGDLNTWEVPPFYTNPAVKIALEDYFVNYSSGYSADFLSQAIETASDQEEKKNLVHTGGDLREYQRKQRSRLGSPAEIDIYLTHKLPHNDAGRTDIQGCVTGDITLEYSAQAKAVYGGHFHDGQVGKHSNLEKWLNEMITKSTVKETVEGVEVPVIYLDPDEPWELNPGTQYFTITEFNEQKKVEAVTVYEFVCE